MLAGMAKGPAYFSPDRFPERSRQRFSYVLKRMQEDKVDQADEATAPPRIVPYEKPRRESGFHFLDHLLREARTLVGMQSLTVESYTVRSTINLKLQRATEAALQEGLARYEVRARRMEFKGPEVNLGESVYRAETDQRTKAQRRGRAKPVWQVALQNARLPLYDVQWPAGIVVERRTGERGQLALKVGLKDGRIIPVDDAGRRRAQQAQALRRHLRSRHRGQDQERRQGGAAGAPQGAGRRGGAGEQDRPHPGHGRRLLLSGEPAQPHHAVAAPARFIHQARRLSRRRCTGVCSPTRWCRIPASRLPPIPGVSTHHWSPKNYDGGGSGVMTMRRALEQSKNMVTARLLDGGVDKDPRRSLELVCGLAVEARIYGECMKNYPFVLGAQALRMINLAGFYASIASEGQRITPYAIDAIEQDGKPVYRHAVTKPTYLADGDRAAFYQLRTILEGVVARGTAASIRQHAGFIGGKTGTTDNENDAWFVGFTNDVTVAVWVGYDNAAGRRTLGQGETGGKNAVPIAEQIIQATWQYHAPKTRWPRRRPSLRAA